MPVAIRNHTDTYRPYGNPILSKQMSRPIEVRNNSFDIIQYGLFGTVIILMRHIRLSAAPNPRGLLH